MIFKVNEHENLGWKKMTENEFQNIQVVSTHALFTFSRVTRFDEAVSFLCNYLNAIKFSTYVAVDCSCNGSLNEFSIKKYFNRNISEIQIKLCLASPLVRLL